MLSLQRGELEVCASDSACVKLALSSRGFREEHEVLVETVCFQISQYS